MTYPNLMAYIHDRSATERSDDWCAQLHLDEQAAFDGDPAMQTVAQELTLAQADYKAAQEAQGCNSYPYNSVMGQFLGLPLRSNHEPPHGYYMASCVMHHCRYGAAYREVKDLLASGAVLRVTLAKSKTTRKPCRFATFSAAQIALEGRDVVAADAKRSIRLSSNWSVETCMESLALALRTGQPYGEKGGSTS
jgi:hypothetical protein